MTNVTPSSAAKRFAVEFDGGHTSDVWADTPEDAADLVRAESSWSDYASPDKYEDRKTVFDSFGLRWEDEDGDEQVRSFTLRLEPDAPPCAKDAHSWSDHAVRGSGGGVVLTSECAHCAWVLTEDTWGTNPTNGEQGAYIVTYRHSEDFEDFEDYTLVDDEEDCA